MPLPPLFMPALLLSIAGVVVLCIIKRGPITSAVAIIIMLGGLLLREVGLGPYLRASATSLAVTEELRPKFIEGTGDLADYALLTALFVFIVVLSIVLLSILMKDLRVRLYTVGALVASLVVRDLSIGLYAYHLLDRSSRAIDGVDAYQLGVLEVLKFYIWTSPYLLLTATIVIFLSARGFRRPLVISCMARCSL